MSERATRLVYVLPRVRIRNGNKKHKMVAVGKAQFWPDEDETWLKVVGKARPRWLDIYRQCRPYIGEEEPKVARGTLVISEDDEWLAKNIQNAVPTLYVLGQPRDKGKPPAEAFQYGGFHATDKPPKAVTFVTKNAVPFLLEHESSLTLFPPLELGRNQWEYRIEIADESYQRMIQRLGGSASPKVVNAELVRRFDKNPKDRIVMACYHLFRSQFANEFMSPLSQDYAAYCACLEAALDIDGTQRAVGANITQRLVKFYPDLARLEDWMKGLYAERSIFVHGASQPKKKYDKDVAEFQKHPHNHDFLRCLCLDVIHDALWKSLSPHSRDLARLQGDDYATLRKTFTSDDYWTAMSRHFKQTNAADKVLAYRDKEKRAFLETCQNFANYHDWRYMGSYPTKRLFDRICG